MQHDPRQISTAGTAFNERRVGEWVDRCGGKQQHALPSISVLRFQGGMYVLPGDGSPDCLEAAKRLGAASVGIVPRGIAETKAEAREIRETFKVAMEPGSERAQKLAKLWSRTSAKTTTAADPEDFPQAAMLGESHAQHLVWVALEKAGGEDFQHWRKLDRDFVLEERTKKDVTQLFLISTRIRDIAKRNCRKLLKVSWDDLVERETLEWCKWYAAPSQPQ